MSPEEEKVLLAALRRRGEQIICLRALVLATGVPSGITESCPPGKLAPAHLRRWRG
jgi:hypothetical protein